MSCKDCDEIQDKGDIAFIRIEAANVGILGCDRHAGAAIRAINAVAKMEEIMETERVVIRMKGEL